MAGVFAVMGPGAAESATKITCVGDSLTQGVGSSEEYAKSYPGVLRTLLQSDGDYQVGNFGFGGSTLGPYAGSYTYTNTNKFQPGVDYAGDVIIFMLGTNDGADGNGSGDHLNDFTTWYDNLISFYTVNRNPAPRIIVATPPWVPVVGGPWNQDRINNTISTIVRNYAAARGYTLVDIQQLTTGHTEWSSDGMVHYNDAGYQAFGAAFRTAVLNGGSPTPVPLMAVSGNGSAISNGSNSPGSGNLTSFGSALVSNATVDHIFRIQNDGSANLSLTGSPAVSVSGTNAADFTVLAQPGSTTIGAGNYTQFTIRFDPTASGTRQATVTIQNNDAAHSPYMFAINGDGQTTYATVINYGDTWQWDIPTSDPGTSWRTASSGWASGVSGSGAGALGFEGGYAGLNLPVALNTAVGGTNQGTVYLFRKSFNFTGSTAGATVIIDQIVDDGVTYYLNGNPLGSVRHVPGAWDVLATSSPPNNGDALEELGAVTGPATGLVSGTNVLSAEVHQATAASSDMLFAVRVKISASSVDSSAWRQENFGSSANSGNGANLADPDKDGLPNLLEFALMQDPNKSGQPWGTPAVEGSNLTLVYNRRDTALSEMTFSCLWAASPAGPWSSTGVTEQILSDDGLAQAVKATVALSGAAKKFLKVQVVAP